MAVLDQEVILKNGERCRIFTPDETDAADLVAQMRQTSGETPFLTRYPDEVSMTAEEEASYLAKMRAAPQELLLVARLRGALVASAGVQCVQDRDKVRHRAVLGISVTKACWGLGLGTALMATLLAFAGNAGYEQVELEYVEGNDRARRLYERLGFHLYAVRPNAFRYRDGTYAAEGLMLLRL
ncbi:MAG TPA: GNAT family N-acetyltransferase [Oscillospiraceae bacterium]|nr:GNAT family N-acetyltransferase [Oscillospiraceae bacterium]